MHLKPLTLLDVSKCEVTRSDVGEWACPSPGCKWALEWLHDYRELHRLFREAKTPISERWQKIAMQRSALLLKVRSEIDEHRATHAETEARP